MKKLVLALSVLAFLAGPKLAMAQDSQEVICPEPYGGGVVCGIHTPVNTGIGDNLALVGFGALSASGVFFYVSKKVRQIQI